GDGDGDESVEDVRDAGDAVGDGAYAQRIRQQRQRGDGDAGERRLRGGGGGGKPVCDHAERGAGDGFGELYDQLREWRANGEYESGIGDGGESVEDVRDAGDAAGDGVHDERICQQRQRGDGDAGERRLCGGGGGGKPVCDHAGRGAGDGPGELHDHVYRRRFDGEYESGVGDGERSGEGIRERGPGPDGNAERLPGSGWCDGGVQPDSGRDGGRQPVHDL